jgi:hypothetical protein
VDHYCLHLGLTPVLVRALHDGRVLSVEREVLDSDIWLVEFP